MHVTYDAQADAAYVCLVPRTEPGESSEQELVEERDIVLDFDRDGRLLGVEVLHASRVLRPETLEDAQRL